MTPNIEVLNRSFGREGGVRFEASPLGGTIARLTAGRHEAVVALQGAQVLSWKTGGRERLWLSPVSRLGTGKGVRGGIPVCWPWFGPHPSDAVKPAHGFVRTAMWDVIATNAADGRSEITLGFRTSQHDKALWPHEADVRLTVALDESLQLSLATRNTGASAIRLTEALHTYFAVADIAQIRIEGLDGQRYIDKMDGDTCKTQTGAIGIDREVDRIYLGDTSAIKLIDQEAGERLAITSTGSRSAVVWNPWSEKSQRLGDMGAPDAYRKMVCIETTNAGDDVMTLPPGASHVMTVQYRVG